MKYAIICITTLLHLVPVFATNETRISSSGNRNNRVFSLFSVVNFPNTQCTILSTANSGLVMFGVCFSVEECKQIGGAADGNCAAGFGVCCMISVSNCGSAINQNLTYIQNPGFPGTFSPAGACSYTFNANSNICQIRLDFDVFIIANPDTGAGVRTIGLCSKDTFVPLSPTGYSPPTICGTNSGTHMYLETGQTTSQASQITFNLSPLATTTTRRSWKIKVSFIECYSEYRAPSDCVQYFTGTAGTFQSYNYLNPGGQVIQNQNYQYCFRQEEGFCAMDISVPPRQLFNLNRADPLVAKSKRSATGCGPIHLSIPTIVVQDGASNTEYFCGWYLNDIVGQAANGVIRATSLPLKIGYFSNAGISSTNIPPQTTSEDSVGFLLDYMQVPC